jgi:hypothetical protein
MVPKDTARKREVITAIGSIGDGNLMPRPSIRNG